MPASSEPGDYVKHLDECDDAIYTGNKIKLVVAVDEESFRLVWKKYVGKRHLPAIDFNKNLAGLILYGEQRTDGHHINVREIITGPAKTNIIAEFSEPNPLIDRVNTRTTSPYVVIEIKKGDIDPKRHYFFLWPKKVTYPCHVADVVE